MFKNIIILCQREKKKIGRKKERKKEDKYMKIEYIKIVQLEIVKESVLFIITLLIYYIKKI